MNTEKTHSGSPHYLENTGFASDPNGYSALGRLLVFSLVFQVVLATFSVWAWVSFVVLSSMVLLFMLVFRATEQESPAAALMPVVPVAESPVSTD